MKACNEKFIDQQIVAKVLRTLTPQFDHIVVTIKEPKDLAEMKVEELQNSLIAHEQRLNERNGDKVYEQTQTCRRNEGAGGRTRKERVSGNIVSGRRVEQIKAILLSRVTMKIIITRREVATNMERSSTRRIFSAIIARSGGISLMIVEAKLCSIRRMKPSYHMMKTRTQMTM